VAEEERFNPRLGAGKTEAEFIAIMAGLNLAYPKRIDVAVPANLVSGLGQLPESGSVAQVMEDLGRQDADIWRGYGI
jgi:hypothetical protein